MSLCMCVIPYRNMFYISLEEVKAWKRKPDETFFFCVTQRCGYKVQNTIYGRKNFMGYQNLDYRQ